MQGKYIALLKKTIVHLLSAKIFQYIATYMYFHF